jgi:ABC-type transport system involved in multi-copper enzyme maturation permease subunit
MLPRFLSPGPLFALEMVTSVRRARYFLVRMLYAAILLLALFIIHQEFNVESRYNSVSQIAAIAQFAWRFFVTFAFLQISAVVIVGPAMAAGTIASERERRTIEYLFTTTLSNTEIVLGKLLARLMHVAYLVLAGMPILFIAMLMGGIAPEAIVVLMIITLSTALTVSIISITVSVWTPRARDAVVRAYLVMIVLFVLPLMMLQSRGTWFYDTIIEPLSSQLLAANPFYVLEEILVKASSSNTAIAWDTLLALVRNHTIVCILGITASTLAVRRVHLTARGSAPKKCRRRLNLFRPAVDNRPMLWKEIVAEPAASRLGAIGRIAMMLILFAILASTAYAFCDSATTTSYTNRPSGYLIYCMSMGTTICCGSLLLIAARAAGAITSEKERDCWTSLITTPLEPKEIILDKIAGNLWAARGVFVLMAIIWGLGLYFDYIFLIPIVFMAGMFLLLAVYASALGVLYSLWCRTSMRAIAATLATGIFVGGAYLFCCIPLMIAGQGRGPGDEIIIMFSGCIPFLIGCPAGIYVQNSMSPQSIQDKEIAAYVIGMIGYAVATVVLISTAIGNFDRFTGRTRALPWDLSLQKKPAKPHLVRPIPPLTEEIIHAEIVEEA